MNANLQASAPGARLALVSRAAITLGMVALGIAAGAKAWWAEDFHASLEAWSSVPEWARTPFTLLLPGLEWGLVAAFFLFGAASRASIARFAFVLIALFTAMLLVETAMDRPPPCNCFGRLLNIEASIDGLRWALTRNAILLALLAPAWLPAPERSRHTHSLEKSHAPALS